MKPATLRAWGKVHTWSSLISTLFLLVLTLTGLPLIFHDEIDGLSKSTRPERWSAADLLPVDSAMAAALARHPGSVPIYLSFDEDRPVINLTTGPTGDAPEARDTIGSLRGELPQRFGVVLGNGAVNIAFDDDKVVPPGDFNQGFPSRQRHGDIGRVLMARCAIDRRDGLALAKTIEIVGQHPVLVAGNPDQATSQKAGHRLHSGVGQLFGGDMGAVIGQAGKCGHDGMLTAIGQDDVGWIRINPEPLQPLSYHLAVVGKTSRRRASKDGFGLWRSRDSDQDVGQAVADARHGCAIDAKFDRIRRGGFDFFTLPGMK